MATDCPVAFYGTCGNTFYFEEVETDVDSDSFQCSENKPELLIRNTDNKYLVLQGEKFQFKSLNAMQLPQADCKFNIVFYKDNELQERPGRAVILYATKAGKTQVACCRQGGEVYAEAMDPPKDIEGATHKALFYMTENSTTNKYMFESTEYRGEFLAFEKTTGPPILHKLVLRHKPVDQVDDFCQLVME